MSGSETQSSGHRETKRRKSMPEEEEKEKNSFPADWLQYLSRLSGALVNFCRSLGDNSNSNGNPQGFNPFKMRKRFLAVYVVFFGLMVTGFVVQVQESVRKFLARKTTIAMQMASMPSIVLPIVSFCPGFKPSGLKPKRVLKEPSLSVSFFDLHPDQGELDIQGIIT